jgi:hypothetical protein
MAVDIPIYNVSFDDRRIAYEGDWRWELYPIPTRSYNMLSPGKARVRFLGESCWAYRYIERGGDLTPWSSLGSRIDVFGRISKAQGNVSIAVWIDNKAMEVLIEDNSGWQRPDIAVYQSPEVAFEEHTLEIEVKDAWGGASFALDQFQIASKINSTTMGGKASSPVPVEALAGGIVGGIVGMVSLLLLWYLLSQHRKRSRESIAENIGVGDEMLHNPSGETVSTGPLVEPTPSTRLTIRKSRTPTNVATGSMTPDLEASGTTLQNPFASNLDDSGLPDQPQQQQLIDAMETLHRYLRLEPEASSSSSNNRQGAAESLPPYDPNTLLGMIGQGSGANGDASQWTAKLAR